MPTIEETGGRVVCTCRERAERDDDAREPIAETLRLLGHEGTDIAVGGYGRSRYAAAHVRIGDIYIHIQGTAEGVYSATVEARRTAGGSSTWTPQEAAQQVRDALARLGDGAGRAA